MLARGVAPIEFPDPFRPDVRGRTFTTFGAGSMRKMLMALCAMFLMAGLVLAVEVTVVSYDKEKKVLKYKDGDAEKTATITKDAKFTTTDRKGANAKDSDLETFEKAVSRKGKNAVKVDITVKDDTITEVTWKAGKGKN